MDRELKSLELFNDLSPVDQRNIMLAEQAGALAAAHLREILQKHLVAESITAEQLEHMVAAEQITEENAWLETRQSGYYNDLGSLKPGLLAFVTMTGKNRVEDILKMRGNAGIVTVRFSEVTTESTPPDEPSYWMDLPHGAFSAADPEFPDREDRIQVYFYTDSREYANTVHPLGAPLALGRYCIVQIFDRAGAFWQNPAYTADGRHTNIDWSVD